ncbi:MAG: hypothetical protein OEY01_03530 [Desulfobulbaceae bacterium]|nr:hypothetical protein [Desulfobulbaceae bacterium]
MKITDITERTFEDAWGLYTEEITWGHFVEGVVDEVGGVTREGNWVTRSEVLKNLSRFKKTLRDTIHCQPLSIQEGIAQGFADELIISAISLGKTRKYFFRTEYIQMGYVEPSWYHLYGVVKGEGFVGYSCMEPVLMTADNKLFMPFAFGMGVKSMEKLIQWVVAQAGINAPGQVLGQHGVNKELENLRGLLYQAKSIAETSTNPLVNDYIRGFLQNL